MVKEALRDTSHTVKFLDWFNEHSPFPSYPELASLSTGMVGTETINGDKSKEIGLAGMKGMIGQSFAEVKLKRNNKIIPLSAMNCSVRIRDEIFAVNTMQIFNRIICVMKSEEDLKECFAFELAPYPLSLFTETTMRKTKKSILCEMFDCQMNLSVDYENTE
jgi:hypothetical protein